MYDKDELRALLPRVGEWRIEIPTMFATCGFGDDLRKPQRCRVVLVNRDHLWYTVEFQDGYRESYKLPAIKEVQPND